jgi:hypothetical protein
MPSNNWGPFSLASSLQYQNSGGTPPPTGNLNPPQSPSGSVTGQSATWNFANSETSTRYFLDSVLNVDSVQQGAPALTHVQIVAEQSVNVSSKNLVNLGT